MSSLAFMSKQHEDSQPLTETSALSKKLMPGLLKKKRSMKFKVIAFTQLLQTKNDGKIWTHKYGLLQAIIKDGKKPIEGLPSRRRKVESTPDQTEEDNPQNKIIKSLLKSSIKICEPEKKSLNTKNLDEFQWSQELYNHLTEKEKILLAETDSEVLTHELHDQRKKEILHHRWTKDVYDPLKKNLQGTIDELPWTSVEAMRHQMHKLYLQYTNTKGHAFLDIVNPKEYPLYNFPHGVPSKIKTKFGPDPLMYQEKQRLAEDRVILCCETGMKYNDNDLEQIKQNSLPQAPLGRDSTDCSKWLKYPLRNIESTPRTVSRRRMYAGRHNSSVMSEIMQDPKKEIIPERCVSQPAYASVHVQTAEANFPNIQPKIQQHSPNTYIVPKRILQKTPS